MDQLDGLVDVDTDPAQLVGDLEVDARDERRRARPALEEVPPVDGERKPDRGGLLREAPAQRLRDSNPEADETPLRRTLRPAGRAPGAGGSMAGPRHGGTVAAPARFPWKTRRGRRAANEVSASRPPGVEGGTAPPPARFRGRISSPRKHCWPCPPGLGRNRGAREGRPRAAGSSSRRPPSGRHLVSAVASDLRTD